MSTHAELVDDLHELLSDTLVSGVRLIVVRSLADEDEISDAVQEILTRAVEAVRAGHLPSSVSLAAYVHGIARHVITDAIKRRIRERRNDVLEELSQEAPSPLEALVQADEVSRVERALRRLRVRDQTLLRRFYVHGERLVDIAADLGEPPARVRKRKSRSLAELRAFIEKDLRRHDSGGGETKRV